VTQVTDVTPLAEPHIEEAAEVLGRAFFNDPFEKYVLPDDDNREGLSALRFGPLLRYGHLFGNVYTTADVPKGTAIWLSPENSEMTDERMEQAGFNVPFVIGSDAFQRLITVADYVEAYRHKDVPKGHWYLLVLGVDRPLQGRGIGSALIQPVLERADAEAAPCYLETFPPSNLLFYQKHGFSVLREGVEPTSGLRFWTFLREPMG
jgi:ribosomal protein S18 acetylase RimI-like enzyme